MVQFAMVTVCVPGEGRAWRWGQEGNYTAWSDRIHVDLSYIDDVFVRFYYEITNRNVSYHIKSQQFESTQRRTTGADLNQNTRIKTNISTIIYINSNRQDRAIRITSYRTEQNQITPHQHM